MRVSNPEGRSPFLLVSDHAGRRRPAALGDLGVGKGCWDRHVAFDIGVKGMGGLLARALDATLIEQRYSRLVIDCNRAPGHEASIPVLSETTRVPANHDLPKTDRREREAEILVPYQDAIAVAIERRSKAARRTILVALHSFTPVYGGVSRPWHASVLHEPDGPQAGRDFALAVLALLAAEPDLVVGDNEPYRLTAASDYTVPRHAWPVGLAHVELEVRQDLIATGAGQAEWAARLARLLTAAERKGGAHMSGMDKGSEILEKPGLDRPDVLTGRTRLAGVVGWPVMHSRSPRLHNFWLQRYGIDGAYVPLAVRPGLLDVALRGLLYSGFAGVNLTIPHKEAALTLCDEHDEVAARAGAVNTLTFTEDGRIFGSNTDGEGFFNNLSSAGVDPTAGPALLLGAGGSSRAIAAALLAKGVCVCVSNRTEGRARALADQLPGLKVIVWEQREDALADHALLVNTTSVGLSGGNASDPEDGAPGSPIELDRAPSNLVVNDIVYVPLQTRLLADAAARGLRTIDGLGMLLHQARPGFAAWFGVDPEIDNEVRARIAIDIPPN